jgi:hypothetical protein
VIIRSTYVLITTASLTQRERVVAKELDVGTGIGQNYAVAQRVQGPLQANPHHDGTSRLPAAQGRLYRGDEFDERPILARDVEYPSRLVVLEAEPNLCVRSTAVPLLGCRPPPCEVRWTNARLAVFVSCAIAGVSICALPADVERTGASEQNANR